MHYELSLGSFFVGLIIVVIGAAFTRYYQWVADNLGAGVASYERYRLYALLTCALGLIVMVNLHAMILTAIGNAIFNR